MAEIKIEKKKPVWPWVLLLLLVGGLVTFFALNDDDNEIDNVGEVYEKEADDISVDAKVATGSDYDANGALNGFYAFVDADDKDYMENEEMGIHHEYTHDALNKLVAALWAKASQIDYNIEADLGTIEENANRIQVDPYATNHADLIRESFNRIANTINNMQDKSYPSLNGEVDKLMAQAKELNPEELTLDQKKNVKGFFDQAATILREME